MKILFLGCLGLLLTLSQVYASEFLETVINIHEETQIKDVKIKTETYVNNEGIETIKTIGEL